MSHIAVLGLGAMGSRMAASLLLAGHQVTVWNRTPGRAEALVNAGAHTAPSPAAAAASADIVLAMVRDDAASQDVWLHPSTGALAAMRPGALAIESSTLTPQWVQQLASRAAQRGIELVDAPVAGSRPQAQARQLIYFVGGSEHAVAQATPVLAQMGAAVHAMGGSGAGAQTKLIVNALFGVQVAAVAELLNLGQASGLDPTRLVDVLGATPVCSPAAKAAAQGMLSRAFDPMFPIELVAKDFGYVAASAAQADVAVPMSQAAHAAFARADQLGLGALHITAVAKLYEKAAVAP